MNHIIIATLILFIATSTINAQDIDSATIQIGIKLQQERRYQEYIDHQTKVIKKYPSRHDLYIFRAKAKEHLKDYKGALIDLDTAILYNKNNFFPLYGMRGKLRYETKDYIGAIEDLSIYIERYKPGTLEYENDFNKGNISEAYYYMAKSKIELNLIQNACKDLKKCIEYNPYYCKDLHKSICN